MQGGHAIGRGQVRVRPLLQQKQREILLTRRGRDYQRRAMFRMSFVHVHTVLEQQPRRIDAEIGEEPRPGRRLGILGGDENARAAGDNDLRIGIKQGQP